MHVCRNVLAQVMGAWLEIVSEAGGLESSGGGCAVKEGGSLLISGVLFLDVFGNVHKGNGEERGGWGTVLCFLWKAGILCSKCRPWAAWA